MFEIELEVATFPLTGFTLLVTAYIRGSKVGGQIFTTLFFKKKENCKN